MKNFNLINKVSKNNLTPVKMSKNSADLINKIKPLENINKFIKNNPNVSIEELNTERIFQLTQYKLSLFLNREIQQEILYGGEFISNKINNEILANKFSFHEDNTSNLYLHKKVNDYFILIHFKYLKPNKDRKRIIEYDNNMIEDFEKNFGNEMGIFTKLTGEDSNPEMLEAKKEDLASQGMQLVEEYYHDLTPFYFNINILNKKSETLQYICHSEENKVSNFILLFDISR